LLWSNAMLVEHTDLKCKGEGCNKNLPEESYNVETKKATWYGYYNGAEIVEWICAECWKNGVRYSEGRNSKK